MRSDFCIVLAIFQCIASFLRKKMGLYTFFDFKALTGALNGSFYGGGSNFPSFRVVFAPCTPGARAHYYLAAAFRRRARAGLSG